MKAANTFVISLLLSLSLIGCQNIPTKFSDNENNQTGQVNLNTAFERDPYESFNRQMFAFNEFLDEYFLLPVTKVYKTVTPTQFRAMVSNFFSNLNMPFTLANDLLQIKPVKFSKDLMRFLINSTVGLLGLFDPASRIGLENYSEDLGQTFGFWGWDDGDYLVLPFLGPSTTTDTLGRIITWQQLEMLDLQERLTRANDIPIAYPFLLQIVNLRAELMQQEAVIFGDRYTFIRSAYLQRRLFDIYDGNPPLQIEEDTKLEDESLPDWLVE